MAKINSVVIMPEEIQSLLTGFFEVSCYDQLTFVQRQRYDQILTKRIASANGLYDHDNDLCEMPREIYDNSPRNNISGSA